MGKRERTRGVCALILLMCAVSLAENRKIDGKDNNTSHPDWGSVYSKYKRICDAAYEDGMSEPAGADRCSPRTISELCTKQKKPVYTPDGCSDYMWAWGQFIDHDMCTTESADPVEPLDIAVPPYDEHFDPWGEGGVYLPCKRTKYDPTTGAALDNPREQVNMVTAWLDASMVYGSTTERATWLRAWHKGRMKVTWHPTYGEMLPYNDGMQDNMGGPRTDFFVAGDVRVNEHAMLTCLHTLFVREHNRWADYLAEEHPEWTDEQIYQKAKKIVGALIQIITYKEYLPALLCDYPLPEYTGYKPDVDPMITNEFATAAYRFGPSMVSPKILRLDEYMQECPDGHMKLEDTYYNPKAITHEGGIEPFLRGMAYQPHQKIDPYIVDALRNNTYAKMDLAALTIQRGRDHGLPDYNTMREWCGLPTYDTIADMTDDLKMRSALECAYGKIHKIDPWVGMMAERKVDGCKLGPLKLHIIWEQFKRLRDGDRFWYKNDPELTEYLPWLESVYLSDIIKHNTKIKYLPEHVFYAPKKPVADEMKIWAAYVVKGDEPGWDTVMVYGNSMDAKHDHMLKCDKVKVWIYVDDEAWPVMYEEIPVSAGSYKYGKFIYRSRNASNVCYLQCDLVKKTIWLIAKKLDMSKMKEKMAVDVQIDGYYGCGETTKYVVK